MFVGYYLPTTQGPLAVINSCTYAPATSSAAAHVFCLLVGPAPTHLARADALVDSDSLLAVHPREPTTKEAKSSHLTCPELMPWSPQWCASLPAITQ